MWKFSFLRKTFLSYAKHSYCKNFFQLVQGVIHKVRPLRFCNLDSHPAIRPHTPLTYSPFPLVRVYGYYFLKFIWQIYFVNYYQLKNHKQRYRIKDLLLYSALELLKVTFTIIYIYSILYNCVRLFYPWQQIQKIQLYVTTNFIFDQLRNYYEIWKFLPFWKTSKKY